MGRKRWLAVIFTVVLAAQAILAGCGNDGASKGGKTEGGEAKTEQAEDGQETDGKTEDQKAFTGIQGNQQCNYIFGKFADV